MSASVHQRGVEGKTLADNLLSALVKVGVHRFLLVNPPVKPAPPQPGGHQRQRGKQRPLPRPVQGEQPDQQPGNHRGNPAPQQITVAAKHLGRQKQAAETAKKMMAGKLTLTDFYDQLQKMKNMGSMEEMLGMLPGVDAKALAGAKIDEKQMAHTEAIIQSMTPKERDNPSIINFSRKKRIAAGCGLSVEQVNKLLKQFEAMQKMTKQLTGLARSKGKKRRGFPGLGNLKLPF
mgnify:CR=1 FL=1